MSKTATQRQEHVHGPHCNHSHDHGHEHTPTFVREGPKIGRNDPCPCGSGKKWKKCCGAPEKNP